jgi:hypothetical protein
MGDCDMIIRVLPNQIPLVWEHIKYATTKANKISSEHMQIYCNNLLVKLLSGKTVAFVLQDTDRIIKILITVSFGVNKFTGEKTMYMDSVYGWTKTSDAEKVDVFNKLKAFAKVNECVYIEGRTYNKKLFSFMESLEPIKEQRQYVFML